MLLRVLYYIVNFEIIALDKYLLLFFKCCFTITQLLFQVNVVNKRLQTNIIITLAPVIF